MMNFILTMMTSMPTWKELAVTLGGSVRVATVDQSKNELHPFYGQQPPLLLLIKKGPPKERTREIDPRYLPKMYAPGKQPDIDGMTAWLIEQGVDLTASAESKPADAAGKPAEVKAEAAEPAEGGKKKASKKGGKKGKGKKKGGGKEDL